jgi:Bacterial pre-peptidase C-terminal domain
MSRHLVLSLLFLGLFLFGCSSDQNLPVPLPEVIAPPPAPPPAPDPDPVDVSGTWFSRTVNNAVNCGLGEFVDAQTIVIAQNGTAIELVTSTGATLAGTVNGDIVEWSGDIAERGGTTTIDSASITVSADAASGNAMWTWTDGTDSCNGTMAIAVDRNWAVQEFGSNSRPGYSQAFDFTDGVAFFTGATNSTNDSTDRYSFVLAADARIQVDLSHFDVSVSDLDLSIIDDKGMQLFASSESSDSFEQVEVQLQAGTTYYVKVFAVSTPADEAYILSIDMN